MEKKAEMDVETLRDNDRQAAARRRALYALLDKLESEKISPKEQQVICAQARNLIAELKKEREQMALYMARESVFVDEAETRLKEITRVSAAKRRVLRPAPTNAQIDAAERRMRHFAQGRSFYKLFWVFFIGCFAGVLVEQIWCFVRTGTFEPRVGLIYGPFNLVYGIGAWALTWALYGFRNRTGLLSFLGGMLIGSAVEYGCSLFQEILTGSVSWDYSDRPFNLNGRICLQYALYWGLLGVVWIKDIYPRMAKAILRIPNRVGRSLTLALCAFMIFNSMMSCAAVLRWTARRQGETPVTRIGAYLDAHYPDERMQRIYSNLIFTEK